jgi:hypothetical protein
LLSGNFILARVLEYDKKHVCGIMAQSTKILKEVIMFEFKRVLSIGQNIDGKGVVNSRFQDVKNLDDYDIVLLNPNLIVYNYYDGFDVENNNYYYIDNEGNRQEGIDYQAMYADVVRMSELLNSFLKSGGDVFSFIPKKEFDFINEEPFLDKRLLNVLYSINVEFIECGCEEYGDYLVVYETIEKFLLCNNPNIRFINYIVNTEPHNFTPLIYSHIGHVLMGMVKKYQGSIVLLPDYIQVEEPADKTEQDQRLVNSLIEIHKDKDNWEERPVIRRGDMPTWCKPFEYDIKHFTKE